jgi:hypothetical protein
MATIRTAIVKAVMVELGVIDALETPNAEDAQWILSKFVRVIDAWNAYRPAVYAEIPTDFTFIPGTGDYTIGPASETPDIVMAIRAVTIDGANVRLTNVSPVISQPINIRDWQWWQFNSVKTIQTSFPTDLYYEPDWPKGKIHFWPVPNVAYGGQLWTRKLLDEDVTLDSTFSMPPGYLNAAIYTTAEESWTQFADVDPRILSKIEELARKYRAIIFANNDFSGKLITRDAGMPGSDSNRSNFNYRSGLNFPSSR